MSTLEYRLERCEFIFWPHEGPQAVRDRLYPGVKLITNSRPLKSLSGHGSFCASWLVDGTSVVLVEVPQ